MPQQTVRRTCAVADHALAPSSIAHESGVAWIATIPAALGLGDSADQPRRSSLVLFENDRPLVPAHSPHQLVRSSGGGAYSHWHDSLYFSTSDGSNPRENGRLYRAFADVAAADLAFGRDTRELIERASRRRLEEQGGGTTPFNQNSDAFADPDAAARYDRQIYEGWVGHLERWAGRTSGLTILELGPGISLGAQILLAERGNRVTVADPFPPDWHHEFHPVAYRMLSRLVGGSQALERAADAGTFCAIDVRRVSEPAEALMSLCDGEFDVLLSNATLEHVADLDRVCAELARVTRIGGIGLHQIDLSYHKDREDPLGHLLLSDPEFFAEARAAHYEYGNRWRKSEFVARFNRCGFAAIHSAVTLAADPDYLVRIAAALARARYGRWPLEDLGALSTFLVLRRAFSPVPMVKGYASAALHAWRKRPMRAARSFVSSEPAIGEPHGF